MACSVRLEKALERMVKQTVASIVSFVETQQCLIVVPRQRIEVPAHPIQAGMARQIDVMRTDPAVYLCRAPHLIPRRPSSSVFSSTSAHRHSPWLQ